MPYAQTIQTAHSLQSTHLNQADPFRLPHPTPRPDFLAHVRYASLLFFLVRRADFPRFFFQPTHLPQAVICKRGGGRRQREFTGCAEQRLALQMPANAPKPKRSHSSPQPCHRGSSGAHSLPWGQPAGDTLAWCCWATLGSFSCNHFFVP